MTPSTSRRKFIRTAGLVSAGFMLVTPESVNAMYNEASPFHGYNPYADSVTDMRKSLNRGDHIKVTGKVYSREGLQELSDVKLEVWHLSPGIKKYRHQAQLTTNEFGEYQFLTDMPEREMGKGARIYFKVTTTNRSYFTELLIGTYNAYITGDHWQQNNCLGDLMQPLKQQSTIQFNLAI